ncbi:MAG: hypothetical protein GY943_21335 [Chloroflexi bacterium]|nr:hypothetical protein [Chloroflexota bacterium]
MLTKNRVILTSLLVLLITACGQNNIPKTETVQATETAVSITTYPTAPPPVATQIAKDDEMGTAIPSPSDTQIHLPLLAVSDATETAVVPTALPAPTATPTATPIPTIDVAALTTQLQANGQDLATIKIGFHAGIGGNHAGLDDWMLTLDQARIPIFLKSTDNAEPLYKAQQLAQASGVPHILIYRRTGNEYDVPKYDLPAIEAARYHWQLHRDAFPPELDPSLVWIETINEIDKNRAEWLAEFALETAQLAMADGFKWAAFSWASGEPEPEHWQLPGMLDFLRLVAANPDKLAIALHEYSYLADDIADLYPYKVGRFQQLFQICDQHGIPRPTVFITEWGWAYREMPPIEQAMAHIAWASQLYAPYPQVKGAAIWYLGGQFGNIANDTQKLIAPMTEYSIFTYFSAPLPPNQAAINPDQFQP